MNAIEHDRADATTGPAGGARADATPRDSRAELAALDRQTREIRDRNVDRAARRLAAADGLTDERREAIERLGEALASRILDVPLRNMAAAAAEDDWETLRVGCEVFQAE